MVNPGTRKVHASTRNRTRWMMSLPAVVLLLVPLAVPAQTGRDLLRQRGAIAIMRHALAPGIGDPPGFELGDCTTQRNLDARGRAQARAAGEAFRAKGIEVDRVLTSQWCRCRETAELLRLATVEMLPALNSFFADRSTRARQTRDTLDFLARRPDGESVALVAHAVNVAALTGRSASSGEIVVITVARDGTVEVLGEIAPAQAVQQESSRPENVRAGSRDASTPIGTPNRSRG